MRVLIVTNSLLENIITPIEQELVRQEHFVATLRSPLMPHDRSRIHYVVGDKLQSEVFRYKTRIRTPWSYVFDPLWMLRCVKTDVVLSFSCHTTVFALLLRSFGRVRFVVHWSIDYSPRRFANPILEFIYTVFDKISVKYSNLHIELTHRAARARKDRYRLEANQDQIVIPVGVNSEFVPSIQPERFYAQKIVFVGNLSRHQGVEEVIRSMTLIREQFPSATCEIVGTGKILKNLDSMVQLLGLTTAIRFHGGISDDNLRSILQSATLGVAPYLEEVGSFSNFGDPSKVKTYIEAGLPVIMTRVPEVASILEGNGCASICQPSAQSIADEACKILGDLERWREMCHSVRRYSCELDWRRILVPLIEEITSA